MVIGLIGAGNMGSALARGLREPVLVHDPLSERAEALAAELGGEALASAAAVAERADLVLLCHKPAQLHEVAAQAGAAKAVASVLAGRTVADLEAAYPGRPVYRFMPNVAAEVGAGVLCYAPGTSAADGPEAELLELFSRAGRVMRVPEELFGPATAVSACTPAFLAVVVEALADAGVRHGLAPSDATAMVVEAMRGTAALMAERQLDPIEVRRRVTSPGGLTARGLAALEEGGARAALEAAVDAVVAGDTG